MPVVGNSPNQLEPSRTKASPINLGALSPTGSKQAIQVVHHHMVQFPHGSNSSFDPPSSLVKAQPITTHHFERR